MLSFGKLIYHRSNIRYLVYNRSLVRFELVERYQSKSKANARRWRSRCIPLSTIRANERAVCIWDGPCIHDIFHDHSLTQTRINCLQNRKKNHRAANATFFLIGWFFSCDLSTFRIVTAMFVCVCACFCVRVCVWLSLVLTLFMYGFFAAY